MKAKKKTYYKVVLSGKINSVNSFIKVNYELNEETKPHIKGSKLFVFENYSDAVYYTKKILDYCDIFACTIKGKSKVVDYFPDYSSVDNILKFWEEYNIAKKRKINISKYLEKSKFAIKRAYWPEGTVWCNSVTLTQKIH